MVGFRTLFVCSLLFFVVANADVDEDEYWRNRAAEAQKMAQDAYNPDPELVTDNLNAAVSR